MMIRMIAQGLMAFGAVTLVNGLITGSGRASVAGGLGMVLGYVAVSRGVRTSTTVDPSRRLLEIDRVRLRSRPETVTVPFDHVSSVLLRRHDQGEYEDRAVLLVLSDGSREVLATGMSVRQMEAMTTTLRELLGL